VDVDALVAILASVGYLDSTNSTDSTDSTLSPAPDVSVWSSLAACLDVPCVEGSYYDMLFTDLLMATLASVMYGSTSLTPPGTPRLDMLTAILERRGEYDDYGSLLTVYAIGELMATSTRLANDVSAFRPQDVRLFLRPMVTLMETLEKQRGGLFRSTADAASRFHQPLRAEHQAALEQANSTTRRVTPYDVISRYLSRWMFSRLPAGPSVDLALLAPAFLVSKAGRLRDVRDLCERFCYAEDAWDSRWLQVRDAPIMDGIAGPGGVLALPVREFVTTRACPVLLRCGLEECPPEIAEDYFRVLHGMRARMSEICADLVVWCEEDPLHAVPGIVAVAAYNLLLEPKIQAIHVLEKLTNRRTRGARDATFDTLLDTLLKLSLKDTTIHFDAVYLYIVTTLVGVIPCRPEDGVWVLRPAVTGLMVKWRDSAEMCLAAVHALGMRGRMSAREDEAQLLYFYTKARCLVASTYHGVNPNLRLCGREDIPGNEVFNHFVRQFQTFPPSAPLGVFAVDTLVFEGYFHAVGKKYYRKNLADAAKVAAAAMCDFGMSVEDVEDVFHFDLLGDAVRAAFERS
jgi:hypothetical protein